MNDQTGGGGYGKRPLWHWILLYLVIGGIVYAAIYYYVYGRNGSSYGYNGGTSSTTQNYGATSTYRY